MKKEMSPWARIKREAPCVQQSYREKKKSRKWLIALAGVLAVALLLSVLRIPERLLQFGEPNTEVSVPAMNLTGVYNSLLAEIIEMEQEADWDGDGLRNGADPYPRDIDADRNGISDGYEGKSIINGELPIEYKNVRSYPIRKAVLFTFVANMWFRHIPGGLHFPTKQERRLF